MKKGIVKALILGIALGILLTLTTGFFIKKKTYFVLEEDCVIAGIGTLKKGAILKYVESTNEGITRYSLYLNTKGLRLTPYEENKKNLVIPYFLFSSEENN
ncbi:MAG: hypothetical protein JJ975_17490 [Bacteroidia bacterium]|nr:hypothetical protein [Bacteroidia bacterium]